MAPTVCMPVYNAAAQHPPSVKVSKQPRIVQISGTLRSISNRTTLRVRPRTLIDLRIHIAGQEDLRKANIGRFVVRTGNGQDSIELPPPHRSTVAQHVFSTPGAAVILFEGGAQKLRASNAWEKVTHCSRTILNVQPDIQSPTVEYPDPGVTSKAGMRVELLPLVHVHQLRIGDNLPVKSYLLGQTLKHTEIHAVLPDGTTISRNSGANGIAFFPMTQSGIWTFRFIQQHENDTLVAELIFELERETPR